MDAHGFSTASFSSSSIRGGDGLCARVLGRVRGVPFVVQVMDRPSFVPTVAQALGRP